MTRSIILDFSSSPKVQLRAKIYTIVDAAVDAGVAYGYRRAHKHTCAPSEDALVDAIATAVMNELCEVIDFGDGEP